MNIELLLRQYLYIHKYVTYFGIGKLAFAPSASLPDQSEKSEPFPLQDLIFTYNLHEELDLDFVAFVSAQTGKIKPLAFADVESYFMLSKQFINIGKAFEVEGIGSVEKQDNGSFAFTPGYYVPVSEASAAPHKPLKIRESQPVVPKTEVKRKPISPNAGLFAIIGAVVALVIIGWAIYFFAFAKKSTNEAPESGSLPVQSADTSLNQSGIRPDSVITPTPAPAAALTGGFKAIVDVKYTRAFADLRAAKLRGFGHNAQVDSVSPTSFRIFIPVRDTVASVDSLKLKTISGRRPTFVPM